MTQRTRRLSVLLVVIAVALAFVGVNRFVEVAEARSTFGERFQNAWTSLGQQDDPLLDWELLRRIQGHDGFPDELRALEGTEIRVVGFVTPHDVNGNLRIHGGRLSNYENPLTFENVAELDLTPMPKSTSFFGRLPRERVRVVIADIAGTRVHAEYPQLYEGVLVLAPDAEHGVVVQLVDAEHLTAASR